MLHSAPPAEGRPDALPRVFLELHLWPQSKTLRSTHDSFFLLLLFRVMGWLFLEDRVGLR